MSLTQQIITIAMVVLGTMLTRFLPFLIFPAGKPTPKYIQYLGNVLPSAVFGLLIVYCLKNVNMLSGSYGIPEFISIAVVVLLHLWKKQMLLSIAGGTICYMLLVQLVFWPTSIYYLTGHTQIFFYTAYILLYALYMHRKRITCIIDIIEVSSYNNKWIKAELFRRFEVKQLDSCHQNWQPYAFSGALSASLWTGSRGI